MKPSFSINAFNKLTVLYYRLKLRNIMTKKEQDTWVSKGFTLSEYLDDKHLNPILERMKYETKI